MKIDETKTIIRKIKAFRPFMQTGNSAREETEFLKEWHKVLEPYDYEDVDRKLDEYFRDGDNIGKIPDVYYITKYLKTHTEKFQANGVWIRCPLCQKEMAQSSLNNHYERCSSVNYVYNKTKEYYNKTLNKDKLFAMSKEEFDSTYLRFLKSLISIVHDTTEKSRIEKVYKLLTGETVEITINEMI